MALSVGYARNRDRSPRRRRDGLPQDDTSLFRKRSRIFCEGDAATAVWEVVEGTVILFKTLPDGRRQITDVAHAGGWLGTPSGTMHTCSAEALTKVQLRRHSILKLSSSPHLQLQVSEYILRRLEALQEHALLLGRKSAIERIATFLLALPVLGAPFGKDRDAFATALKQRDIGDYLGLKVETVSRNLATLKKRMIIATAKRGQFRLLDREALRLIAVAS